MTKKRSFTKEQLIEWRVANVPTELIGAYQCYESPLDMDEPSPVVADEHDHMGDEEVRMRVFRAPDDGILYAIEYEAGGSKSGYDEMDPPNLNSRLSGYAVAAKEITTTVYIAV